MKGKELIKGFEFLQPLWELGINKMDFCKSRDAYIVRTANRAIRRDGLVYTLSQALELARGQEFSEDDTFEPRSIFSYCIQNDDGTYSNRPKDK